MTTNIKKLEARGVEVMGFAAHMLKQLDSFDGSVPLLVKFAVHTVAELGFEEQPTLSEIIVRIRELGGQPCEPLDGPRLAVWEEAPRHPGDGYWCAMQCINGESETSVGGGKPCVFYLMRAASGTLRLCAQWITEEHRFRLRDRIMYRLAA